jgi:UDP-glucose 4-epimerase
VKILVTGGAGYIGSHAAARLLDDGYSVIVADNLSNSSVSAIEGVEKITGRKLPFYEVDLCNLVATEEIFASHKFGGIIHFAGLKAVPESVTKPVMYYENNLTSTINLCKCMKKFGVAQIIFSSSATVYSIDNPMPLNESATLGACNPYGWSKFMCEQVLHDFAVSEKGVSVVSLRYFNPVGAHKSGLIGEEPNGIPNNLMPFIAQTARGMHSEIKVFGNDYPTPDGTGVRDYIHVTDLVDGHIRAIDFAKNNAGFETFNLGTGRGASVLEMIHTFESANGLKLPYSISPRRAGDAAVSLADPSKAEKVLGFRAEKTLEDMCRDTWNFQKGTAK